MYVISLLLKNKKLPRSFRTFQKTCLIGIAALSSSSSSTLSSSSSRFLCEAFQATGNISSSSSSSRLNQSTCSSLDAHSSNSCSNSMTSTTWDHSPLRLEAMQKVVLPLSEDSHKGSSGRVAVLGGSARYTGAPYYAAMASLKAGADLAYIFTATEAALPIKSYSPELMVSAVYTASDFDEIVQQDADLQSDKAQTLVQAMVNQVVIELDRLHCLVIGPGMGRCPLVMKAVSRILMAAKQRNLHVILDADALYMLSLPEYQNLLSGYNKAILTPNTVEYQRLFPSGGGEGQSPPINNNLKHVTVVRKGKEDVVMVVQPEDYNNGKNSNDEQQQQQSATTTITTQQQHHLTCSEPGGLKRSGGIGDILAGTLGTTVAWHSILLRQRGGHEANTAFSDDLPLACWTACCFVKRATYMAFQEKHRSMTAPDVLQALGSSIDQMTRN